MVLSLTACGNDEIPLENLPQSSASKPVSAPNNSKPAATINGEKVCQIGRDYTSPFDGSITDVNIPNSANTIGGYAFRSCTRLESITLPDSIGLIYEGAFSGCSNIKVTYKGKEYDFAHLERLYSDVEGT